MAADDRPAPDETRGAAGPAARLPPPIASAGPPVDLGRVLKLTFVIVGRRLVPLALVAFLVEAPWLLLHVRWLRAFLRGDSDDLGFFHFLLLPWLDLAVYHLLRCALLALLIRDIGERIRGRRGGFVHGLGDGIRRLPAAVASGALWGFLVCIGLALFVAPGILAWCIGYLLVPVVAAESRDRRGGSLDRAEGLVKGQRWRIIGIAVLFVVLRRAIQTVAGTVAFLGFSDTWWAMAAAQLVSGPIADVFHVAGWAVLYHEVVRAREGPSPDELAEVFA